MSDINRLQTLSGILTEGTQTEMREDTAFPLMTFYLCEVLQDATLDVGEYGQRGLTLRAGEFVGRRGAQAMGEDSFTLDQLDTMQTFTSTVFKTTGAAKQVANWLNSSSFIKTANPDQPVVKIISRTLTIT